MSRLFFPENLPGKTTTTYSVEIAHTRSEGVVASPVAGEEQNVSLVRIHSPMEYFSVYWTAVRDGAPPLLPSHKSYLQNLNKVFLGGERHGVVYPSLVGHTWLAAGVFHYVIVGPEGLSSDFPLSRCPWEDTNEASFYIPAENFKIDGILNDMIVNPSLQTSPGAPEPFPLDEDVPLLNGLILERP